MAIVEKVGVYRKWLEPVPKDKNDNPIPKSEWARKRRYCWVVRWCGTNKKKYGKLFKKRKEAERYALDLQKQVNLGRADRPQKITLHDFRVEHERVMKGQVAYATIQEHKRALELFENFIGGSFALSRIRPRHAEAFVANCLASNEVSVATVNKWARTLKSIFTRAIDPRGYLAEGQNPFSKIKERKITERPIRYVDLMEYTALMDAATKLWWKAFLSIAYGSGLRLNEILHLTWADVDLGQHHIKVKAKKAKADILAWEPKGRKNRTVPMSNESAKLLVDMQVNSPELHPYIFVSPERLDRIKKRRKAGKWHARSEVVNNMGERFKTIRRHANVAECTIHDLRRSAITNWAMELPIHVVQTLAGHEKIATTRKYYLAVRPEDFVSASKVVNLVLSRTPSD
jgi:integrase